MTALNAQAPERIKLTHVLYSSNGLPTPSRVVLEAVLVKGSNPPTYQVERVLVDHASSTADGERVPTTPLRPRP